MAKAIYSIFTNPTASFGRAHSHKRKNGTEVWMWCESYFILIEKIWWTIWNWCYSMGTPWTRRLSFAFKRKQIDVPHKLSTITSFMISARCTVLLSIGHQDHKSTYYTWIHENEHRILTFCSTMFNTHFFFFLLRYYVWPPPEII